MNRRQAWTAVAMVLLAGLAQGCGGGTLETGYKYTPLGDTPVQRRAYYAGPFSPEARQAQIEQIQQGNLNRRPDPGY